MLYLSPLNNGLNLVWLVSISTASSAYADKLMAESCRLQANFHLSNYLSRDMINKNEWLAITNAYNVLNPEFTATVSDFVFFGFEYPTGRQAEITTTIFPNRFFSFSFILYSFQAWIMNFAVVFNVVTGPTRKLQKRLSESTIHQYTVCVSR